MPPETVPLEFVNAEVFPIGYPTSAEDIAAGNFTLQLHSEEYGVMQSSMSVGCITTFYILLRTRSSITRRAQLDGTYRSRMNNN